MTRRQRVGVVDICLGPASFAQANPGAMSTALAALAKWVPKQSAVVDMHAGIGTIGASTKPMIGIDKALTPVNLCVSAEYFIPTYIVIIIRSITASMQRE